MQQLKPLIRKTINIASQALKAAPFYFIGLFLAMLPRKKNHKLQFPGKTLLWSTEGDGVTEYLGSVVIKFWEEIYKSQIDAAVAHPSLLKKAHTIVDRPNNLADAFRLIRKNRYQTIVFLQPRESIVHSGLAALAGVKNRVGFGRSLGSVFLNFKLPFQDTGVHFCHQWKQLIENSSMTKISAMPFPEFIPDKNILPLFSAEKLAIISLKTSVLDPFALESAPLLPVPGESQIEELKYQLEKEGYRVRVMRADENRDFPESLTYDEVFASAAKADLVVDFDTPAGHVAAAAGTPVLSIFAERSEKAFQPFQNKSRAYGIHLPCRPCHRTGNNFQCRNTEKFQCVNGLNFEKALEIMQKKPAPLKRENSNRSPT